MSDADPLRLAERALAVSRFPAVVLEVATGRIVAANPSASSVLDPQARDVVGALLEDFTLDDPLGELELFESGQVTGFEAVRTLARPGGGVPVRTWTHKFDHASPEEHVLVILVLEQTEDAPPRSEHDVELDGFGVVAGTIGEDLSVGAVSREAASLFGSTADKLLGNSLLSLIEPADRARTLLGVAEAAETGRGITLYVDVMHRGAGPDPTSVGCELVIVPLSPPPSCFFVLLPTADSMPRARLSEDLAGVLSRLAQGVTASPVRARFDGRAGQDRTGLDGLTAREREVLDLLVAGQRVPAIARILFLSASTVRTHVSAIERKLGVSTQQQVIDMLSGGNTLFGRQSPRS